MLWSPDGARLLTCPASGWGAATIWDPARGEVAAKFSKEGAERSLSGVDGLLVPGGFDTRGIEGKIEAIRFARETGLPFFGICLGLQCATIEFARNVLGLDGANSTEFNKATPDPVVCLLSEQVGITNLGGTQRVALDGAHRLLAGRHLLRGRAGGTDFLPPPGQIGSA